jgi:hypothetical protein
LFVAQHPAKRLECLATLSCVPWHGQDGHFNEVSTMRVSATEANNQLGWDSKM